VPILKVKEEPRRESTLKVKTDPVKPQPARTEPTSASFEPPSGWSGGKPRKAPPAADKTKDIHKTPPHSVEAEQGVISSIMQDCQRGGRDVIAYVSQKINENFFFVPAHHTIYLMLVSLWRANHPLDLISFTEYLHTKNVLASLGGAAAVTEIYGYIDKLTGYVPTAANVEYYVHILVEKFGRREIIADATRTVRAAYGDDEDEFHHRVHVLSTRMAHIVSVSSNGYQQFDHEKLLAFNPKADPDCLVGFRWLNRGGAALWAGGSGYGKSSLEMQFGIYWGCGKSCFGLRPVRPLKSLIVQAENDEGDTAEQLQGVIKGIEQIGDLDVTQKMDLIKQNVVIYRVIGKSGHEFLEFLDGLLQADRPDLVWIDPLFAFAGCDLLNPEKTGHFLREGLFPIADKRRVCLNVVHHIGKPPRDQNGKEPPMTEVDYQYLGFGTSEIQNAFRAVNILIPVKKGGGFKLVFSKRGERAGAKDIDGEWSREIFIEHSKEGICWLQKAAPEEIEGTGGERFTKQDILDEMSVIHPIKTDTVYKRCYRERNATRATFFRLWAQLKRDKRIVQREGGWVKDNTPNETKPPEENQSQPELDTRNDTSNETNEPERPF